MDWATLIRSWTDVRVLLVGDFLLDRWVYGTIRRISREAPVFVVEHEDERWGLGGAANTAAQLTAYRAQVWTVGWLGDDPEGRRLLHMMQERGIHTDGLVWLNDRPTVVKTRIVAGPLYAVRQQVLRIDQGSSAERHPVYREQVLRHIQRILPEVDLVLVSDYGYGAGDEELVRITVATARSRGIPVIGDSHDRLHAFRGASAITPNESEFAQTAGQLWTDEMELERLMRAYCHRQELDGLLVTRGSRGMALYERAHDRVTWYSVIGSPSPVDVAGAGDTVLATFGLVYTVTRDFRLAAHVANAAGGIVVMKPGIVQATPDELQTVLETSAFPDEHA